MNKIITRCFQRGGAFSNVYRRLVKSALTAFALIAATFTANAANVISINFTQNGVDKGALDDSAVYSNLADANITGAAWNTFSGASSGVQSGTNLTLEKYWDGAQAKSNGTAKVSYEAANMWNGPDRDVPYLVGYLDDGAHNGINGPTVTVTGIPYEAYDVIIYANTDNGSGDSVFRPVTVNGISYTYADGATVKGTANWGGRQAALEVGKNALRVTELTGNLHIQGGNHSGGRGCIAAIQIVERPVDAVVSGANLRFLSGWGQNVKTTTDNWWDPNDTDGSSKPYLWRWDAWADRIKHERIAYGRNAYVIRNGYNPGMKINWPNMTAFSMAFVVDITDMTGDPEKWSVMACLGGIYDYENSLVLFKNPDGGVSLRPRKLGVDDDNNVLTIPASEITQGYHLFVVTCDTATDVIALRMDDGTGDKTKSMIYDCQLSVGFQLGKNWNGTTPATWQYGIGMGVYAVYGWERALSGTEIDAILAVYDNAIGTPVAYNYISDFNNGYNDSILSVPTMTGDDYPLKGTRGTIDIPTNSTVTVPSVCLGNSDTAYDYAFNVNGTLNVTSTSGYNVYNVRNDNRGILFGHYHGTGVENIYGTLNASNCWIQACLTFTSTTLNINGGKVTALGIYRASRDGNASSASISNGGVLEVAELKLDASWPLTCGEGTIRARDIDGATGLTHNYDVTFTDAAVGTTLDPNGLAINFTGTVGGAGKIIIDDTSDGETKGAVSFSSALCSLSGPIEVRSGALNLGTVRPTGTITFAEGAKLVLVESLADGNNRIALKIAGDLTANDVTLTRSNGDAYTGALTVETDSETNLKYIAFETNTDPDVSGTACWYDFEFEFENDSYNSSGRIGGNLDADGTYGIGRLQNYSNFTDGNEYAGRALYTASDAYMTVTYPDSWAAAVYATIPQQTNAVLMTFGTNGGGFIGLICGDPEKNEVKLVRTTGNSKYTELATMTVPRPAPLCVLQVREQD